jgi:D-cysteine desulfhydrase
LRERLPHVALADLPTPVARMERLEQSVKEQLGGGALYVKRDDLSGKAYGGNKVRKLEFLLGQALRDGKKAVLTFGAAGSNHALATAIYAAQVGLGSVSMLVPQPNTHATRRNLLMSWRVGADLHHHGGILQVAAAALYQLCRRKALDGRFPQIIPAGGSSALGMVGFVNAGLELKHQIDAGELPEPDYVYAASGTMGTAVGLLLGFQAADLRTRVVAVRVTDPRFTSPRKARRFFRAANALLHRADPSFRLMAFPESRFVFRHDFYGEAYALYTEEALCAVRRARETEGIKLEGTYTGKTFAALLADLESGALRDKTVLFWHTYDGHDFSEIIAGLDYHRLPKTLYRYFEKDVQPLDR